MGRDFDDAYSSMVRQPKYALICFSVLLLLTKRNAPLHFDHVLVGMLFTLSMLSFLLIALFQIMAVPHALWVMFKKGRLRSWRHWLVVFCGIAVLALGVFVLKSLANDLLR